MSRPPVPKHLAAIALAVSLVALVALLAACSPDQPTLPDGAALVRVPAPIESFSLRVAEATPPRYILLVRSGLPNSCVRFGDYALAREGTTIRVTVSNLQPADKNVICAPVYTAKETSIPLGAQFDPGRSYTVVVNGVTKTFTAQSAAGKVSAVLGRPFQLRVSQTALVETDALALRLVDVPEDSRCPPAVVCVQAGQARALVALSKGGAALGQLELVLGAARQGAESAALGDYTITLVAVGPFPVVVAPGQSRPDYVATLAVSRSQAQALHGGVLATFDVGDERIHIWATNPVTIQKLVALRKRPNTPLVPTGPVLRGPGPGDHNAPWNWHLDPHEVGVTELPQEVCSGGASQPENWQAALFFSCLSAAYLVDLQDLRDQ